MIPTAATFLLPAEVLTEAAEDEAAAGLEEAGLEAWEETAAAELEEAGLEAAEEEAATEELAAGDEAAEDEAAADEEGAADEETALDEDPEVTKKKKKWIKKKFPCFKVITRSGLNGKVGGVRNVRTRTKA